MSEMGTDEGGRSEGELSYEAAREELVQVVQKLEAGGVSLAESLQLWERGERLADTCQRWLDGARERIEQARADRDSGGEAAGETE
ncbi:exodeoxyribonuclease VII small subunit [Propionibacteriaceae bacterium ES.041]|nr:exodeoxyribonuclease VII small subunit [Propionibacteriaceae bacterium ES.041]TDO86335.1 exodeoxyribonuclease VII small subunit [Enemella evansiae]